jgi:hypothetical protein
MKRRQNSPFTLFLPLSQNGNSIVIHKQNAKTIILQSKDRFTMVYHVFTTLIFGWDFLKQVWCSVNLNNPESVANRFILVGGRLATVYSGQLFDRRLSLF